MYVKDFDLGDDLDLLFDISGDFLVTESDQNHVIVILTTYLGSFREFPLVGLGINRYMAATIEPSVLTRDIKVQLIADNYDVQGIKVFTDYTYEINANRLL